MGPAGGLGFPEQSVLSFAARSVELEDIGPIVQQLGPVPASRRKKG